MLKFAVGVPMRRVLQNGIARVGRRWGRGFRVDIEAAFGRSKGATVSVVRIARTTDENGNTVRHDAPRPWLLPQL